MKLQMIALSGLIGLSMAATAQTKKIAFESHSGNPENLNIAINSEFFDGGESNYGLPSSKSKFKLDSVIYINDTASVLVSKEYQAPFQSKSESDYRYIGTKKDTIFNHKLLTRKIPLDSIRNGMAHIYGAWDVVEANKKTVFVGFSKKGDKKSQEKEKEVVPIIWDNRPPGSSPFDAQVWLIAGATLLLSVVGGYISWKLYKPRPSYA